METSAGGIGEQEDESDEEEDEEEDDDEDDSLRSFFGPLSVASAAGDAKEDNEENRDLRTGHDM